VLAVLPAAAVFFLAYGRYDGAFRDNVVFLYFIGGLLVGGVLGLVSLLALGNLAPLISVVIIALFYPVTVVLGINRRKWQGDPHAVFNGGALGLGAAVMIGLSLLYRTTLTLTQSAREALGDAASDADLASWVNARAFTPNALAQAFVLAAGLAGLFFGLGLLAGDSVRRRKALPSSFLGAAIALPPAVFLEEYFASGQVWLWVVLLLAYGAIFGALANRRLLPRGLTDESRRAIRRRRRAE